MTIRMAFVVAAAHAALKAQVARINALNVYPVPDGDTGTNMLLTLESILKETRDNAYDTPEAASKAGARAALMGARGNSGVILSQMIRGACDVLAQRASLTAETFAAALEGARERAYASIREPVEGTMLTVIKDAAHAAREALADKSADLPSVVRTAARAAHASVKRTPELLGVLREAGVVDAGGLGVAVILDGIHACLTGQKVEVPDDEESGAPDLEAIHAGEEAWGYCTEFLVTGIEGDAEELEDYIYANGKSVLVIPDDDVIKVHLHTQDPGSALSYAGRFGRLSGVKVDDMEAQVHLRSGGDASGQGTEHILAEIGVVVASRGSGNRELFESMGAVVIEGGQGANPSASEFAEAVEKTGASAVIILPNNKNIVPTAEQVSELVEADVYVVPTTTIAGGLAVMVGFDVEAEAHNVAGEMREISDSLHNAEITRAARDAKIGERDISEGSYIGILDGELRISGQSVGEVALKLAEEILSAGADVITLLKGEDLSDADLEELAGKIQNLDEDALVETRDGGQPMYPLQMVAE